MDAKESPKLLTAKLLKKTLTTVLTGDMVKQEESIPSYGSRLRIKQVGSAVEDRCGERASSSEEEA